MAFYEGSLNLLVTLYQITDMEEDKAREKMPEKIIQKVQNRETTHNTLEIN
jgi:hypothetical protein